ICLAAVKILGQSQLGTGAISGSVQDQNGAMVAGASITITNAGTGLVRNVSTSSAGQFSVPVLPPGEYQLRIEQSGFATLEQKGIIVTVGSTVTLRLEMRAGGIGEVINVIAESPVDATKTAETTLIDRAQINDLPINGRRADQFALLAPGVARDGRFGLLSY